MQITLTAQQRARLTGAAAAGLLLLCAVRIYIVITVAADALPLGGDAQSYLAAARAVMHGQSPVGVNSAQFLPEAGPSIPEYLYPPFLALVLIPLAALPYPTSLFIWLALVAAATALLIPLLSPLVGWRVALCGVLFFLPTWESLWLGQINALVTALVVLALLLLNRRKDGYAGLALAIGALIKMTPALSLLALAQHRRWGGVRAAAATALAVIALSLPLTSVDMWTRGLLYALTNTWRSPLLLSWTAIMRAQDGPVGAFGPALLSTAMLGAMLWRGPRVPLRQILGATIILPLLISGIIWHYSALLALPALATIWGYSARGRAVALLSWATISLIGGLAMPITLTLCWAVCCWPALLDPSPA